MSVSFDIRWHGRGGQGIVTAALLLATAAVNEGKYALAIPFFGAERRGAPVVAFNRISDKPIRARSSVKNPDVVVVLDPHLPMIVDVTKGLKHGGVVVVNSLGKPKISCPPGARVYVVDATGIALNNKLMLAGIALVNMPMLGALVKATGVVKLESVLEVVKSTWSGEVGERNVRGVIEGYNSVKEVM